MSKSLNISLGGQLRRYVDSRTGNDELYATPSEYIRDLIRRDMEDHGIVSHVLKGLEDVKEGKFSKKSVLDLIKQD